MLLEETNVCMNVFRVEIIAKHYRSRRPFLKLNKKNNSARRRSKQLRFSVVIFFLYNANINAIKRHFPKYIWLIANVFGQSKYVRCFDSRRRIKLFSVGH